MAGADTSCLRGALRCWFLAHPTLPRRETSHRRSDSIGDTDKHRASTHRTDGTTVGIVGRAARERTAAHWMEPGSPSVASLSARNSSSGCFYSLQQGNAVVGPAQRFTLPSLRVRSSRDQVPLCAPLGRNCSIGLDQMPLVMFYSVK